MLNALGAVISVADCLSLFGAISHFLQIITQSQTILTVKVRVRERNSKSVSSREKNIKMTIVRDDGWGENPSKVIELGL